MHKTKMSSANLENIVDNSNRTTSMKTWTHSSRLTYSFIFLTEHTRIMQSDAITRYTSPLLLLQKMKKQWYNWIKDVSIKKILYSALRSSLILVRQCSKRSNFKEWDVIFGGIRLNMISLGTLTISFLVPNSGELYLNVKII